MDSLTYVETAKYLGITYDAIKSNVKRHQMHPDIKAYEKKKETNKTMIENENVKVTADNSAIPMNENLKPAVVPTPTDNVKVEVDNKHVDEVLDGKTNIDSDAQINSSYTGAGTSNEPCNEKYQGCLKSDKAKDDNCDVLRPSITDADVVAITRMSASEQNSLKLKINQFDLRAILPADKRGDGFICPICGNGSGHTGDGIKPKSALDNAGNYIWLYHCFARGDFEGDLIKIISTTNNLDTSSDFQRILAIGKKIIENSSVATYAPPQVPVDNDSELSDEELKLIQADIAESQKHLSKLPLEDMRGITFDTFQHFHCGYCAQWVHVKAKARLEGKHIPPTRRIIIPTSSTSYVAVMPKRDRNETNIKWKAQNAGHKHIFNVKAIVPNKPVIVVEGEFDALSIWQATGGNVNVIAIGGASSHRKFLEYVEEKISADSRQDYQFIIIFDNDSTGISKAQELADTLIKIGCPAISDFLSTDAGKVDANDILTSQGESALKLRVEEIVTSAQIELSTLSEKILAEKNINRKLSEYEEFYGQIQAKTKKEIRQAIEYLNGFMTPKDLTAEIVSSVKTARYLAICLEYGFSDVAENFLDKAAMATNFKFSRNTITKGVTLARKTIRKAQENYVQELAQELEKNKKAQQENQKAQQELEERQERQEEIKKEIAALKLQPASQARDKKIIELIKSQCEWDKNKYIKGTQKNFDLIFDNDPLIDGLFGYNEFANSIVFRKQPYWKRESVIDENWTETDDAELRIYLRRNYEEIPTKKISDDSIISLANRNSFHPVKQYFESLKWDGTPRAETVFSKFLGVEDNEYSREITLNWLLGAIARIYYPACDFQNTPVLQGKQGIGKGRIIKALAKKWYVSLSMDCADSHAIDALQAAWVVELEETTTYKKSEVSAMKSFITKTTDTNRFAYCKKTENRKRHCAFIMTNNNAEFLKDVTGNRRFRILKCLNTGNEIDSILSSENCTMEEYTDQILAEVKVKFDEIFKNGFDAGKLQLSTTTHEKAEEIAENHMIDDGLTTDIKSFVDTPIPRKPVWLLMTKEERRKFIEQSHIILSESDLLNRLQALPAKFKKDTDLEKELQQVIDQTKQATGALTPSRDFYGQEFRQHICAAEIYSECFGIDKRKSMTRISEVLSTLENWEVGNRLQNVDPRYTDQRKPYYRITDETDTTPTNDSSGGFTDDDFTDEVIPDSCTPF